jgi:hypothetical protein
MINFFKRNVFNSPKRGDLYAASYGIYKGKFFILVDKSSDTYGFLISPDLKNIKVPVSEFDIGRQSGILDLVENLKGDVWKVVKKKYEENDRNPV